MLKVFITGSSDGIGLLSARSLIAKGHTVTLHARNAERASDAQDAAPGAAGVIVGDISTVQGMKELAAKANQVAGAFDVVVHNAGIGSNPPFTKTADGFAQLFAVNSLAPYVLTALMHPPRRLVYTSSTLHTGGDDSLDDVTWSSGRRWSGFQAYSDSKLHNVLLANAVARKWKGVKSNSVHPGWIKTKLVSYSAPGSAQSGADCLVDLIAPTGDVAGATGGYFSARRQAKPHHAALDEENQEKLMRIYEHLSGISFPSDAD